MLSLGQIPADLGYPWNLETTQTANDLRILVLTGFPVMPRMETALLPEGRSKCKFYKPNNHTSVILKLLCRVVLPICIPSAQDFSLINQSLRGDDSLPIGGLEGWGRNAYLRRTFVPGTAV